MTAVTGPSYPTRPRWTLTYKVAGVSHSRDYDVLTEVEARTRLTLDVPAAYDVQASYSEVPIS